MVAPRVAPGEIGPYFRKKVGERATFRLAEAAKGRFTGRGGKLLERPVHQRTGGICEKEPANAPIRRIRPPLDPACAFETIQQADEGDRLDLEHIRQSCLAGAFGTREIGENRPLRSGEARTARSALEIPAHQPRRIMEKKTKSQGEHGNIKLDTVCLI